MNMKLEYSAVKSAARKLRFRTQAFIDGKFVNAQGGKTFTTENPATGQPLAQIAACDAPDVERAVKAARRAFETGTWSRMKPAGRKKVLLKYADLLEANAIARMHASVDAIPQQIEDFRKRSEKSSSNPEKAFCAEQIRQFEAYRDEMQDFTLELPSITFEKSYLLKDPAFDLQLDFHGHAHTAGDIFVYCPQQRALATGDASHCWLPNIADGYPRLWPTTLDEVAKADFKYLLGGHGPMQTDRTVMTSQRNYIEELVEKVEEGKKAGHTLEEMKQRLTVESLKSMQSNGYGKFLAKTIADDNTHFGSMPPLQNDVNDNIRDVYNNLDKT